MTEKEHSTLGPTEEVDFTPDAPDNPEFAREPTEEELYEKAQAESHQVMLRMARLYYLLFTMPDGAEVLKDMYEAYMLRSSFDETNPGCCSTSYCEGQRSVVLQIQSLMDLGQESPE